MPQPAYEHLLLERLHATHRWENQPVVEGVTLADLDEAEIQRTVDEAVRRGRLESPRSRELAEVLRGFGLIIGDRLLNAAIALFGKDERLRVWYPQLTLRVARFRG